MRYRAALVVLAGCFLLVGSPGLAEAANVPPVDSWTQLSPANSPSARQSTAMAFDESTGEMVLFGGYSGSASLNETWVWDGSDWTQLSPAHVPPVRTAPSMAFDPASGNILMFGGAGPLGSRDDT